MRILKGILGIILVITAVVGLLISLFAVVTIWRWRPTVYTNFSGTLNVAGNTLSSTSEGLAIVSDSLKTSRQSMGALQKTVITTASTISTTTPLVDSLARLTKDDLPKTIQSAQTSLNSAAQSAGLIDSMLSTLAALPLVPKNIYNPKTPLHTSLQQLSASMNDLPSTFSNMESSLTATGNNLVVVRSEIGEIAVSLSQIDASLSNAQGVVVEYQNLVSGWQSNLDQVKVNLLLWIDLAAWGLTAILIWIALTQVGLFIQGWELLQKSRSQSKAD